MRFESRVVGWAWVLWWGFLLFKLLLYLSIGIGCMLGSMVMSLGSSTTIACLKCLTNFNEIHGWLIMTSS